MTAKKSADLSEHYVYLYRDDKGKPRYVGYGKNPSRAIAHLSGSHNEALSDFLAKRKHGLEIAGPFGTEAAGRAVETALISALKPDCNLAPGQSQWRFRPFGIPVEFADRMSLPPLTRANFLQPRAGSRSPSVLFVYIARKDFKGRPGYDPAKPPTAKQILKRMIKCWQIGKYVSQWRENVLQSPTLLVGLSGSPKARIVIGAARVDQTRWKHAKPEGGLYEVPIIPSSNLDASKLRCRRISPEANIEFGSFASQFFVILECDGTTKGGRSPKQ